MASSISNTDSILDSRDIIERIEELQAEQDALIEAYREASPAIGGHTLLSDYSAARAALADFWGIDPEEVEDAVEAIDNPEDSFNGHEELYSLKRLQDDAGGYAPDWTYGATLIHEDHFVDYCEELVKDIGDLPRDMPGYLVIDWDATAENLRADYTSVEFDGQTYWVR